MIDTTLLSFGAIAGAGVVLMIIGGRLRSFARAQQREQGGMQIMTVKQDDPKSQDETFDTLRAELTTFQTVVPGLPPLPQRWNDYDGWFDEVLKRVRLRSQQRTADEQIQLEARALQLEKQHLELWKNRYELTETGYAFKRLRDKASKDDDELQKQRDEIRAQRKEIEVRMKVADVRMAELDAQLKNIREGKPVESGPTMEDPIQKRIAHIITNVRTSAGLRAEGIKLQDQYPGEADFIDREIRKAIGRLREG